jgi:hypothetical protein
MVKQAQALCHRHLLRKSLVNQGFAAFGGCVQGVRGHLYADTADRAAIRPRFGRHRLRQRLAPTAQRLVAKAVVKACCRQHNPPAFNPCRTPMKLLRRLSLFSLSLLLVGGAFGLSLALPLPAHAAAISSPVT